MSETSLDRRIVRSLARLASPRGEDNFDSSAYAAAFHESAREKAGKVSALLAEIEELTGKKPVFISVGGADGEELAWLLSHSTAHLGILIEFNRLLADAARKRNTILRETSKEIRVFEGQAQEKVIDAVHEACNEVRRGRADFVAITCHAVLHELFDRGKGFEPLRFFGAMFKDHHVPVWFSYREPGRPEKWPKEVKISANCTAENLLQLAQTIRERHPALADLSPTPFIVGDGVEMHKNLAMEVLAKLFYIDDLEYEIAERYTSVDHRHLLNALHLATEGRVRPTLLSESSATRSFQKLWHEMGIRVIGVNEDFSSYELEVPESHTRVTLWRPTPATSSNTPSTVDNQLGQPDSVLSTCRVALETGDSFVIEACLTTHGRAWVESARISEARELLRSILDRCKNTRAYILAYFLNALPDLFDNTLPEDTFSEEKESAASKFGLGLLFRAERMETARTAGDLQNAVEIANSFGDSDPSNLARICTQNSNGLGKIESHYQTATVLFLFGNLLRHGGRYPEALAFVKKAQGIYLEGVPAHDAEIAHCRYAILTCNSVLGDASLADFDPSEHSRHAFASALIQLSLAHAAWLLGDSDRAETHAAEAGKSFAAIGLKHYADRAKLMRNLLLVWRSKELRQAPNLETLAPDLRSILSGLMGLSDDFSGVEKELRMGRPGRVMGLLQFSLGIPEVRERRLDLSFPAAIKIEGGKILLSSRGHLETIGELDRQLRDVIGVAPNERVPLLP
jgi:tetratricopeptide (TPR) repeat protein